MFELFYEDHVLPITVAPIKRSGCGFHKVIQAELQRKLKL